MESSYLAAFLKDSKPVAGSFVRRYHVVAWLVVASTLLTALVMRESEVTVIILGVNLVLVWLAVGLFKNGPAGFWLVILAEILSATQMRPNRGSVMALLLNMALLLFAIIAARLGAPDRDAA
jgi:hypothetical protein